jgi:uncharacterized protein (PEP-CTERM system associated)
MLTAADAARSQYVPSVPPGVSPPGTPPLAPGTPPPDGATTTAEGRLQPQGWRVRPEITLRETYTDNAFIGQGDPRSDWVTLVTPGIRIDGRSRRLTADFAYTPSAVFYARNSEGNDVINNLDAFGRLEAVDNFFFIEAKAKIGQTFITPFAGQPSDIAFASTNRVETRTFSLSPYVRHVGSNLEYELRNANFWTDAASSGLGKFRTQKWTGYVARPVRTFGAALEFDHTDISYYDSLVDRNDDTSRLYRARLYWQPDPAWRLSVSGGEEENNYVLQQTQRSSIYGGALAWRPSARTSGDLEYEQRFFGPSKLARFSHRTRLSAWTLTYSRNTSTYQEEVLRLPPGNTAELLDTAFLARFPDPAQRRAVVEQFQNLSGTPTFLANSLAFYTQRVYLREGVDASVAFVGRRNSIVLTAFAADNSDISADVLGLLPDAILLARRIKQRGFGATAQHSLTPSTSIGANASRINSREEQPAQIQSRNEYLNVYLRHSLSPKTIAFSGVSLIRFQSDDSRATPNQDANAVYVGLTHLF